MIRDPNELELTVDKFTFRFPRDLLYTDAGLWFKREGGLIRMGLSDFAQQRNGDIAFANLALPGTALDPGDELASIETVNSIPDDERELWRVAIELEYAAYSEEAS